MQEYDIGNGLLNLFQELLFYCLWDTSKNEISKASWYSVDLKLYESIVAPISKMILLCKGLRNTRNVHIPVNCFMKD